MALFGLALVAAFSVGVELVQIVLVSRTPSLTDAALYFVGVLAGFGLISWITSTSE